MVNVTTKFRFPWKALRLSSSSVVHLRAPWQPISINCTLHISKAFVINIAAVISNLYVDACAFSRHYSIFSRTPKCPVSYPWRYACPRLGITALDEEQFASQGPCCIVFVYTCGPNQQWLARCQLPGSAEHVRKISDS
jgi:hypothetical protein